MSIVYFNTYLGIILATVRHFFVRVFFCVKIISLNKQPTDELRGVSFFCLCTMYIFGLTWVFFSYRFTMFSNWLAHDIMISSWFATDDIMDNTFYAFVCTVFSLLQQLVDHNTPLSTNFFLVSFRWIEKKLFDYHDSFYLNYYPLFFHHFWFPYTESYRCIRNNKKTAKKK